MVFLQPRPFEAPKSREENHPLKMSELVFNPVFQEVSHLFTGQTFSAMYFGQHFWKKLLVLKHDLTLLVVFENDKWPVPEFIKSISFRGEKRKGVQIVGSEDVVLLLDECGRLWKFINAFDVSKEEGECFHSLEKECFYEWVPFKKFTSLKVLALSAFGHGFACIGIGTNSVKKLSVLSTLDSTVEDYSFEDLNSNTSCSYYLTNLNINYPCPIWSDLEKQQTFLVADRFSGKTYLCGRNGRNCLVNVSNNYLISALHLVQNKCLMLGFENGKLIFIFYNEFKKQSVVFLSRKLVLIEQCCCSESCLLWSDGMNLSHSKLTFQCGDDFVKVSDLALSCFIQSPVSILKANQHAIVVTINNFYYCVSAGMRQAEEFKKKPEKLLSEICRGSSLAEKLEKKTDLLAHLLHCKDVIDKGPVGGKMKINWEGKDLVIKSSLEISFKEEHWRVRLMRSELDRKSVRMVNLESDLAKGMPVRLENPFKSKCKLRVSLVGHFDGRSLFVDLGEVDEVETT